MCKARILCWKGQTVVSECVNCHVMNIWHNNLLLNFSREEFLSFKKAINSLPFDEHCLPFPDDTERVVLRTPNQDINFTFGYEDFEIFKQTIDEALYIAEVYAMLQ